MKVLIAGDVHGAYWTHHVLKTADELDIPIAIIVGDCWDVSYDYSQHKAQPLFVEGNHEQPLQWMIGVKRGVCLPDYHTFELDGSKFGVVSRIDEVNHAHLEREVPWLYHALGPKPDIWMTKQDFDFSGIDVLLCHDGPYPTQFEDMETGELRVSGSRYLSGIVERFKPSYVFHGHYHTYFDRVMQGTRVIGLNQQHRGGHNSMAIYDTVTKQVERII